MKSNMDVLFVLIASGWPVDDVQFNKDRLGHMYRGSTSAINYMDMAGWANKGFPADGTPRIGHALRILYQTPPFAGPFKRQ